MCAKVLNRQSTDNFCSVVYQEVLIILWSFIVHRSLLTIGSIAPRSIKHKPFYTYAFLYGASVVLKRTSASEFIVSSCTWGKEQAADGAICFTKIRMSYVDIRTSLKTFEMMMQQVVLQHHWGCTLLEVALQNCKMAVECFTTSGNLLMHLLPTKGTCIFFESCSWWASEGRGGWPPAGTTSMHN